MNWKKEIKQMLKLAGEGFIFLCYMISTIVFILSHQTDKQRAMLLELVSDKEGNWTVIVIVVLGIVLVSMIMERLFRIIVLTIILIIKSIINR